MYVSAAARVACLGRFEAEKPEAGDDDVPHCGVYTRIFNAIIPYRMQVSVW